MQHAYVEREMTAYAFVEEIQKSLDAGMNGHLSKPIVMDEVVKSLPGI